MGCFRRIFHRLLRRKYFRHFVIADDKPECLMPNTIYCIGDPSPWSLVFICPCGCGSEVELNVLQDIRPSWKYAGSEARSLSIYPSVWLIDDCGAHFSIKDGKVKWY